MRIPPIAICGRPRVDTFDACRAIGMAVTSGCLWDAHAECADMHLRPTGSLGRFPGQWRYSADSVMLGVGRKCIIGRNARASRNDVGRMCKKGDIAFASRRDTGVTPGASRAPYHAQGSMRVA